jgi:hypothetical protein
MRRIARSHASSFRLRPLAALMAIPTKFDGQLAEIEDLAGLVMIKLRRPGHGAREGGHIGCVVN